MQCYLTDLRTKELICFNSSVCRVELSEKLWMGGWGYFSNKTKVFSYRKLNLLTSIRYKYNFIHRVIQKFQECAISSQENEISYISLHHIFEVVVVTFHPFNSVLRYLFEVNNKYWIDLLGYCLNFDSFSSPNIDWKSLSKIRTTRLISPRSDNYC
jgi:hypothetical protein